MSLNTDDLKLGSFIEDAVTVIGSTLGAVLGINPTNNSAEKYENEVFSMAAYDWSEERHWNFRWRDFEMSWYKYIGRGVEVNRPLSAEEIVEMIQECVGSVK